MLHLNGGKIADPTVRDRFPVDEVDALPRGCWHTPRVVSVDNPAETHQALVATLELCPGGIRDVPGGAHPGGVTEPASACARWATIVLRSPHGDRPERVTDRVPRLSVVPAHAHKLMEHKRHVREQGEDLPRVREWQWLPEEHPVLVTPGPRPKFPRAEGR
jgi:xylulose-5-phosphate/fructose-6-phosphate phosphoketolase